eukprot:TRINITY_DN65950_c0_g1_i1.p1 TRINITY_DN65950_c0_g1~~TRINITY_DN65950_c0_g1_i1.p1  ORF type:complete len:176 (-),score=20.10 TRINITY_DN65950_c0_g1_i1:133-660(-)
MAGTMRRTMTYVRSLGASMMRRPRRVHIEPLEESFLSVSVGGGRAAEDDDEDKEQHSTRQTTFGTADAMSDDDCDSNFSDDTVEGTRYRTVTIYGIAHPNALPEFVASPRPSTTILRARIVDDVLQIQMPDSSEYIDSDLFSLSSCSTRFGEEGVEASDDEDAWEDSAHVSDVSR